MKRIYYDSITGGWIVVVDKDELVNEKIEYIDVDDMILDGVAMFHIENKQVVVDKTDEECRVEQENQMLIDEGVLEGET